MIEVTDAAAAQLLELLEEKGASPEEQGLRLLVERGGCAGLQYAMRIGAPEPGDEISSNGAARVFVDAASLPHLQGVRLHYEDSLNDAGFKIENPNATRSCGCGTSFEPAQATARS